MGRVTARRIFLVTADSTSLAREVSLAAETYRRELSRQWLGYELKPWSAPVPIQVNVASHLGAWRCDELYL